MISKYLVSKLFSNICMDENVNKKAYQYALLKFGIKEGTFPNKLYGYKTDNKDIRSIINLCQSHSFNHVKFKKAKLVPAKFALAFECIDK